MKRYAFTALILIGLLLVPHSSPADPPANAQPDPADSRITPLMRMKLDHAKSLLEGLTIEDFEMVRRSAKQLKVLSLESGWNIIQTGEYRVQSQDFKRACDVIAEAAEDKNIGRVALGYVALTVRCVECHGYMKRHKQEEEQSLGRIR